VFSEAHLRRILKTYASYYKEALTLSLDRGRSIIDVRSPAATLLRFQSGRAASSRRSALVFGRRGSSPLDAPLVRCGGVLWRAGAMNRSPMSLKGAKGGIAGSDRVTSRRVSPAARSFIKQSG
jgi:hypothetical protein